MIASMSTAIRLAREQQPSGRMAEDREPRILERVEDARRHRLLVHLELRVHGSDHVVEAVERRVVVVELAVQANVRFDALEDPEVVERRVQLVDLVVLARDGVALMPPA